LVNAANKKEQLISSKATEQINIRQCERKKERKKAEEKMRQTSYCNVKNK
jgi:hypothetical protein